jgi:hypothetical protein
MRCAYCTLESFIARPHPDPPHKGGREKAAAHPVIRDQRFILWRDSPGLRLHFIRAYGPLSLLRVVAGFFAGKYLLGDQA